MERISEGSGVGVAGRIFIKVDHEQYAPGDLVTGTVFVTIADSIQCKELLVILDGKESVTWDESEGSTNETFERELLHHKIALCPAKTHFEPGDFEYQFTYQLPLVLPTTFNVENEYYGPLERLRVDTRYTATAWLTVDGSSVSYIAATHPFFVYVPATAAALTTAPQPVHETREEHLRFLCCLERGVCEVRASSAKRVLVAGDTFQLEYQIRNQQSACAINWVRVELVEEVTLIDVGQRTGMRVPRVIATHQFPGVIAGYNSELQRLDLKLATASPGSAVASVPVNASTTCQHFAAAHMVRITCKPFMCRSFVLELPLTVLHAIAAKDTIVGSDRPSAGAEASGTNA